jgi:flavin-binding protein dodecin
MSEYTEDDPRMVTGSSPVSIEAALHDAVLKAVDKGIASVGDILVIEHQSVRIDNPKIGEYRVAVRPGG